MKIIGIFKRFLLGRLFPKMQNKTASPSLEALPYDTLFAELPVGSSLIFYRDIELISSDGGYSQTLLDDGATIINVTTDESRTFQPLEIWPIIRVNEYDEDSGSFFIVLKQRNLIFNICVSVLNPSGGMPKTVDEFNVAFKDYFAIALDVTAP